MKEKSRKIQKILDSTIADLNAKEHQVDLLEANPNLQYPDSNANKNAHVASSMARLLSKLSDLEMKEKNATLRAERLEERLKSSAEDITRYKEENFVLFGFFGE